MNPLALFSGPYAMLARIGIVLAILAAALTTGWVIGNNHGTQKLLDYQGKQAIESVKVITKQGAVTEKIVKQYVDRIKVVAGATTTIEKEVTKYVDSKPLTLACMLDERWVRLHDAAATGTVPPAASTTDGASGGINAVEALPTITGNYAKAIRNKDKLNGLQEWVREQYEQTNGAKLGY